MAKEAEKTYKERRGKAFGVAAGIAVLRGIGSWAGSAAAKSAAAKVGMAAMALNGTETLGAQEKKMIAFWDREIELLKRSGLLRKDARNAVRLATYRKLKADYLRWVRQGRPPQHNPALKAHGRPLSRRVQLARRRAVKAAMAANRGSRARYTRTRIASPKEFDPRSFRTIDPGRPGRHKMIVGCPKGQWDPGRKRCKTGMETQAVLKEAGRNPGAKWHNLLEEAEKARASLAIAEGKWSMASEHHAKSIAHKQSQIASHVPIKRAIASTATEDIERAKRQGFYRNPLKKFGRNAPKSYHLRKMTEAKKMQVLRARQGGDSYFRGISTGELLAHRASARHRAARNPLLMVVPNPGSLRPGVLVLEAGAPKPRKILRVEKDGVITREADGSEGWLSLDEAEKQAARASALFGRPSRNPRKTPGTIRVLAGPFASYQDARWEADNQLRIRGENANIRISTMPDAEKTYFLVLLVTGAGKNPPYKWHERQSVRYGKLLGDDMKAGHGAAADYWQGAASAETAAKAWHKHGPGSKRVSKNPSSYQIHPRVRALRAISDSGASGQVDGRNVDPVVAGAILKFLAAQTHNWADTLAKEPIMNLVQYAYKNAKRR